MFGFLTRFIAGLLKKARTSSDPPRRRYYDGGTQYSRRMRGGFLPSDPYAPVRQSRTSGPGGTRSSAGAVAVERLTLLNQQGDWKRLATEAEEHIEETPDWLLLYVFAGIAHVMNGDRTRGVERLEFVVRQTGAQSAYVDAAKRILVGFPN